MQEKSFEKAFKSTPSSYITHVGVLIKYTRYKAILSITISVIFNTTCTKQSSKSAIEFSKHKTISESQ